MTDKNGAAERLAAERLKEIEDLLQYPQIAPPLIGQLAKACWDLLAEVKRLRDSHAQGPAEGNWRIDRPCSACSAGDYEMKHHKHTLPATADARGVLEKALRVALQVMERFMGDAGWRGHGPNKDIFYCEYCRQSSADSSKIPHLEYCHMRQLDAAVALAESALSQAQSGKEVTK